MAIRFNDGSKSIEFSIEGYEFPTMSDEEKNYHDLNWLNLHVRYEEDGRIYEGTDPCLMTGELKSIRDALNDFTDESIPAGHIFDTDYGFIFTENYLRFAIIKYGKDVYLIKTFVYLSDVLGTEGPIEMTTPVDITQLKELISQLDEAMETWPERE